ncbi:MAG: HAMP domain-containing histidine kinase [Deltaproteobacteria bacterium]|nr:HAMP domain-containing histidine kinase [Deltaproteobacteria bacterium]
MNVFTKAPLRVSTRIGAVLFAAVVVVLAVGLLSMRLVGGTSAADLRRAGAAPGLAMARVLLTHSNLPPEQLGTQLGDVPGFSLAWYGPSGARLGQSHAGVDLVLHQLDPVDMRRADQSPGQPVFLQLDSIDSPTMAIMAIDRRDSKDIAYIGLFETELRVQLERLRKRVVAVLVVSALALAALASRWLAGRVRGRIVETRDVVKRIADGDLDGRLRADAVGDDELGELARDFNRMAQKVQTLVQDLREDDSRRRESFAGFAHEVNTPLASASAYLEALNTRHAQALPADARRYVQVACAQVQALGALCQDLETLAALEFDGVRMDCGPAALREIALAEVEALRLRAEAKGVAVQVEGDTGVAWVDRGRTAQILRNLLDNAIRHTLAGRQVRVHVADGAEWVQVEVRDEGEGIAGDLLARLGQPLFRTDASRDRSTGGRGLGLASALGLVRAQGGQHSISSQPGVGTTVLLRLPARAPQPADPGQMSTKVNAAPR